jgi:hypothetical protein
MDCPPGRLFAAASRSSHGLDGVNYFVAAVQTGFGSFVTDYLVKNEWPPDAIGFALTIATLCSLPRSRGRPVASDSCAPAGRPRSGPWSAF